jgi:type IV secretory pathway VirB2 component (pilin)
MVYCTECGEKNPDDAEFCVKCGVALYPERGHGRGWDRRDRDMCFGVPVGGHVWGIIIGLIIILWGMSHFVGFRFNFMAIMAVVFGVIILLGAFRGASSRR